MLIEPKRLVSRQGRILKCPQGRPQATGCKSEPAKGRLIFIKAIAAILSYLHIALAVVAYWGC